MKLKAQELKRYLKETDGTSLRRWLVFLSALLLYLICLDRGASLWDCPEYILIAWRLEIGHPPGNPTWQLIANVLSHLVGSARHAAIVINAMSALSMALAATLLSNIIYILLRGSLLRKPMPGATRSLTAPQLANVCALLGALCYAWCDSAIFSAIEAEVYALSALLTALMIWLALRWAIARSRGRIAASRRILVLTAYLAGLGVGVHELNFLVLPAMALIYWYGARRFPVTRNKGEKRRIPVRTDGLPTALMSLLLFIVGTTTYIIIPIRAAARPPVNTGNPATLESFLSYYNRDQYGSKPLLYGHTPYSEPLVLEEYDPETDRYDYNVYYLKEGPRGSKDYVYPDELNMWFPRMTSSHPADIEFYEQWAGMTPDNMVKVKASVVADSTGKQMGMMNEATGEREMRETYRPTYLQQMKYLAKYQIGFMYFRYLLWNFSGRQNNWTADGGDRYGNFITGIPPIDDAMLGPQSQLPARITDNNRGHNRYFLIPLLFGLAGIVALCLGGREGRRVCAIVAAFFLFTGLLIVIYLNQDPGEPRERDYSFLGSYMAFAIWIACGMAALIKWMVTTKKASAKQRMILQITALLTCAAVPLEMLTQTFDDHDRRDSKRAEDVLEIVLEGVEPNAIVMANGDNVVFPLWYMQEVLGMRRDITVIVLPYLTSDWYLDQLRIPGEGAPGLELEDPIPQTGGSYRQSIINHIIDVNRGKRPVYNVYNMEPAIRIDTISGK